MKLHYFHLAGLGEPIRYLLHYGGIPFEDVRIGAKEWPEHKKKMPMGRMPVLEVNGKMYHQSRAICRYIAERVGLTGATPEDNLQIDMAVDTFYDLRSVVVDWFYDSNPRTKAAKLAPLERDHLPFYLNRFEAMAQENSGYLANGKLTWADFYFVAPMTWFNSMLCKDVLDGYPLLQELKRKVESYPQIAAYIAQRTQAHKLCPRFVGSANPCTASSVPNMQPNQVDRCMALP